LTAPTLVFDLDGTLVDTAGDLIAALNAVLAGEGLAPLEPKTAITMVGHGSRVLLESALKANRVEPESDRLDNLVALFIDHYSRHIADESRPFPGAPAALDHFAAAGWRLAVCTNKLEGLSRQLLAALGLLDRFAAITGQDTFGVRKPDPRHLLETIRLAGGRPEDAVMVGDSIVDVDTAKAAGIPVIAVAFGYSALPVNDLGADRVIGHFDELLAAVAEVQARRSVIALSLTSKAAAP
jgi:phosphoglycolate phosphatase